MTHLSEPINRVPGPSFRTGGGVSILTVWLFSILAFLGYYIVSPPRAQGVSPTIVISQIYGGGGNTGATLKNDFIELFNRGSSAVSVTGWSVQYASAAGTTWSVTNLSGSIAPGHHFLVQEAAGTGGTTNLPAPDATGTIAMAATAGKVALVNSTTALGGACPTGATIIDFVGFGSTTCFEGTGSTPAPGNTTAVLRAANGCTDTDNNATDFSTGTANPRNNASPANTCASAPITPLCPPNVSTTFGTAASAGVSATDSDGTVTTASITGITPFDPGTISLTGFTAAGSVGGTASAMIQVSNSTPIGNYNVPITWSNNDSIPQTAACTIGVAVNGAVIPIHDIQGSGVTSPMVGAQVTTSGIVTGVKTNGFFIQAPAAEYDSDSNTSEGVFVFTSSAPSMAAAIGNRVVVTGTVSEFIPFADPQSPPQTEISGSPSVTLSSTGNALPSAITLTAADTPTNGTIEQLERFEGMRVQVNSITVVAPTQGTLSEASATSNSNGVFYGVITGVARPFREPGIQANDPVPAGSGVTIPPVPRFDFNPERLRVDSIGLVGGTPLNLTTGVVVTGLVGLVEYSFRTYTLLPDPSSHPSVTPNTNAIPVPVPAADEFTVASFNMQRFYDAADDPSTSDVVLTTTAFNNRLNKASLAIRNVMHTPDIIGVEEMENLTTLQAVANKVNSDAVAAGSPNPGYAASLVEGNDADGIDVGFLVKTAAVFGSTPRVAVNSVVQEGAATPFVNPDSSASLLNDRPPLRLTAVLNHADGRSFPITVIVNHLRSLSGIDSTTAGTSGWTTEGARVRAKRRAQAEFLANLIQARQTADPNERVVLIGDYNSFQFNDGYVDVIGTTKGMPTPASQVVLASADLVTPDLIDLIDMSPVDQRYSYSFDGDAQVIDHEIITGNMLAAFSHLAFARNNADFPETLRNDPTRPERISDHDMPVAYFTFPCAIACPVNVTRPNDTDRCGAVVNYPASTASNNCFPVACSPSSGSFFPAGTTTVTCAESLGSGAACSFTVTVNDTQPPAITPPANVSKPTDSNKCTAVVNFPAPVVTDNCSSSTQARKHSAALAPVCNPVSGSTFSKGTTTVICTVIDSSGNQASCRFSVSVADTQPPVFINGCLADIYTAAAVQCPLASSRALSYTYPVAADNCPGVVVTCNPPTGSTFPLGATAVNCTAADTSGNTAACSFQVNLFSLCLVDDSNPGNVVLFNATNGDYYYCCNGIPAASGRGVLTVRGCVIGIDDSKGNRKVRISADTSAGEGAGAGSAFIRRANSQTCSITDKSMVGDGCSCN
jgi:predicted extracellular nuclease